MIIGIDIGGTFTDVVCVEPATGEVTLTKVITNHRNINESLLAGLHKILALAGREPGSVERIVIGTTVATNVIVQRAGAKTLLLTTAGFRDVLEIGRLKRRAMYDLDIDVQTPVFLAPRRLRVDVPERVDAAGNVVVPLDEAFVARKVRAMRRRHGIEAVAVSYLFSFENNAHELRTREIVRRVEPEMFVSLSCEVNPEYREYERTVVTAFDAYLRPVVERAMEDMEAELRACGVTGEVHVMQSHGGVTTTRNAGRRPVNLFLSGPAGGGVGGAQIARASGRADAVTIDIGGTSCDVAVVDGGVPTVAASGEIAGYPVRVPMVDLNTIGAGGGSLLEVEGTGMMRVGPASAGSEPGPACYGRGGTRATITDASALLGYLNPRGFAGGSFDLDLGRATQAMDEVGRAMGLSAVEAALGAHRIMNVQMAEQIRLITVKRGFDPRQFTLMAFGGAGPLHAGALTSMLAMKDCLIPPTPGVLSAYGLLNANIEVEQGESFLRRLDEIDHADLAASLAALAERARAVMREDGMDADAARFRYTADLRYTGQDYEIIVTLREAKSATARLKALGEDFEAQYFKMYGHTNKTAIEIVNLRAVAYKAVEHLVDVALRDSGGEANAPEGERDVWFLGAATPTATTIYRRERLRPGAHLAGPAVIEQTDTTILVYPGQTTTVDARNNLRISGISEAYAQ